MMKVSRSDWPDLCTSPWHARRGRGKRGCWRAPRLGGCTPRSWPAAVWRTAPRTRRRRPGARWWCRKRCRSCRVWTTWRQSRCGAGEGRSARASGSQLVARYPWCDALGSSSYSARGSNRILRGVMRSRWGRWGEQRWKKMKEKRELGN